MYVGSNEIITFLDNLFLCSWRPIMPSVYRHRERALNCGMHSLSFVNNWSTRPEAGLQWGGGGGGGRWTGWTGVLRGRWGEEEGWENNSLLSAGVPGKEQVRRYPLHCFYSVYLTPVHRGEVRRRRGRGRGRGRRGRRGGGGGGDGVISGLIRTVQQKKTNPKHICTNVQKE